MQRREPIDIGNSEIDTPVDEMTEEGRIVVEDGQMREGLAIFICRGHDFTEVGSCLNAIKGMHQASFDWILAPSLWNLIPLGFGESSKERLQYRSEFRMCLSLNPYKYRKSSFKSVSDLVYMRETYI